MTDPKLLRVGSTFGKSTGPHWRAMSCGGGLSRQILPPGITPIPAREQTGEAVRAAPPLLPDHHRGPPMTDPDPIPVPDDPSTSHPPPGPSERSCIRLDAPPDPMSADDLFEMALAKIKKVLLNVSEVEISREEFEAMRGGPPWPSVVTDGVPGNVVGVRHREGGVTLEGEQVPEKWFKLVEQSIMAAVPPDSTITPDPIPASVVIPDDPSHPRLTPGTYEEMPLTLVAPLDSPIMLAPTPTVSEEEIRQIRAKLEEGGAIVAIPTAIPEIVRLTEPTLATLQPRAYAISVANGYHSRPMDADGATIAAALIGTEVSELIEEIRHHGLTDHARHRLEPATKPGKPPKPEGIGPELADIIIRALDLAAALGIDAEAMVLEKMAYNAKRGTRHEEGKAF